MPLNPRDEYFLDVGELEFDDENRAVNFKRLHSPPICINMEDAEIEQLCTDHIQQISREYRDEDEVTMGETSALVGKVLKAIIKYSKHVSVVHWLMFQVVRSNML